MFGDAERALFKRLEAFDLTGWDLCKPGKPYDPKPDKPYIETYFLQPSRIRSSFGFGRTSTMRGQYQISLFYPADAKSQQPLIDMADNLANWFYPTHRRGGLWSYGTTDVEINDLPVPGPLIKGVPHHMKPLTITHQFDDNPA